MDFPDLYADQSGRRYFLQLCGSQNERKGAVNMKFKNFAKKNKFFCLFAFLAFLIILAAVFAPVLTGGVDPAASVL